MDWILNFQQNLLEESKTAKNTIEEQQRIIEDQRKQLEDIDNNIKEKIDIALHNYSKRI